MNDQSKDPVDAPPSVDPSERLDTDYSPSSGRETEQLQRDQDGSRALDDPDIDRSAIRLLPGTGDPTDDGQVEVDPKDVRMPSLPGRTEAGPPTE